MKIHSYSIILFLGCLFFTFSCEKSSEDSNLSLTELGITTRLANNDGTTPLSLYGPTDIDFSVRSDKGHVDLVQFFYQGVELKSFTSQSGSLHFIPDTSKDTDLEMRITLTAGQNKYHKTVNYKIEYIEVGTISKEDFELKEETIDRFVFKMVGKKLETYKYIFEGKVIEDLDNIVVKRKFAYFSFPIESSIRIILVPKKVEYISSLSREYPSVEINMKDKKLGNFHIGSSIAHYIDGARKELYVWTLSEMSIFDKDMNEVKHQSMTKSIERFFVSPKTGLVIFTPTFGNIVTYSNKSFNTIVSSIDLKLFRGILAVNERDQFFNAQNFTIDVYDLYTGKSIYSLDFEEYISGINIIGDKLLVKLGNDGENHVYQLNEKSTTFLYSFNKQYRNCAVHPINRNHIILDNTYNGFEIFDLESRKSLFSFKGQFQSIDPITGTLLYYDENYNTNNYDNLIIDLNYNRISVFQDASRSTYGAFLQFNNYIIKSDRYTNLLPR